MSSYVCRIHGLSCEDGMCSACDEEIQQQMEEEDPRDLVTRDSRGASCAADYGDSYDMRYGVDPMGDLEDTMLYPDEETAMLVGLNGYRELEQRASQIEKLVNNVERHNNRVRLSCLILF